MPSRPNVIILHRVRETLRLHGRNIFFFFEQEISKIFWIESNRFDESPKKKKRNVKRKIGLSHIEVKQIENYYY